MEDFKKLIAGKGDVGSTVGSLARFFLCSACGRKNLAKLLVQATPPVSTLTH